MSETRTKAWARFAGQVLLRGLLIAAIGAIVANGYLVLRSTWEVARVAGAMDVVAFIVAGIGILAVISGLMGAPGGFTGNAVFGSSRASGSSAYGLRQGQYAFFLYCLLGSGLLMAAAAVVRTLAG